MIALAHWCHVCSVSGSFPCKYIKFSWFFITGCLWKLLLVCSETSDSVVWLWRGGIFKAIDLVRPRLWTLSRLWMTKPKFQFTRSLSAPWVCFGVQSGSQVEPLSRIRAPLLGLLFRVSLSCLGSFPRLLPGGQQSFPSECQLLGPPCGHSCGDLGLARHACCLPVLIPTPILYPAAYVRSSELSENCFAFCPPF